MEAGSTQPWAGSSWGLAVHPVCASKGCWFEAHHRECPLALGAPPSSAIAITSPLTTFPPSLPPHLFPPSLLKNPRVFLNSLLDPALCEHRQCLLRGPHRPSLSSQSLPWLHKAPFLGRPVCTLVPDSSLPIPASLHPTPSFSPSPSVHDHSSRSLPRPCHLQEAALCDSRPWRGMAWRELTRNIAEESCDHFEKRYPLLSTKLKC